MKFYYLELFSDYFEIKFIFFVLAALTKSAKIPFSSWLSAAITASTPVSALVHSSSLLTAGVYLLIRFSPSFSYWLNVILLLVSVLTIFITGLGANFEFDLNRIIALSTLRQLRIGQLQGGFKPSALDGRMRQISHGPDDPAQQKPRLVQ